MNNERQRYLETDDRQLLLFTKLALHTGARLHTICNIKKKDISMTLRYTKLSPDSGRDYVAKLYA